MMLTLLVLVFITFFVVLVLCCGVCNKDEGSNKVCVAFSWLLFLAFTGLFVAILVFLGKSQDKVERVLCNIYLLPSGVIDGIKDEGNEFIGLGNLR